MDLKQLKKEFPYLFSGKLVRVHDMPEDNEVLTLHYKADTHSIIYNVVGYGEVIDKSFKEFLKTAKTDGLCIAENMPIYESAVEEFMELSADWLFNDSEEDVRQFADLQRYASIATENVERQTDILLSSADIRTAISSFLKQFVKNHDISADQFGDVVSAHKNDMLAKALARYVKNNR